MVHVRAAWTMRGFDPRPRAGSDVVNSFRGLWMIRFRSAPPCGERPPVCRHRSATTRCFDPRPRAGSDALDGKVRKSAGAVSIRAPVRGATTTASVSSAGKQQFRSAPPCGERPPGLSLNPTTGVFRSAPPCGERLLESVVYTVGQRVSIRAPVRGATLCFNGRA